MLWTDTRCRVGSQNRGVYPLSGTTYPVTTSRLMLHPQWERMAPLARCNASSASSRSKFGRFSACVSCSTVTSGSMRLLLGGSGGADALLARGGSSALGSANRPRRLRLRVADLVGGHRLEQVLAALERGVRLGDQVTASDEHRVAVVGELERL